ncbi:MAG: hypothetical protein ACKPE3_04345, partial [Sphaerospermopsis kisseleviana]
MVEKSLPELTNVDLEVLFNELLEGVHQARGQQWALKYLQRMEPRITVERWIDWLLIFSEKLLSSPAPNSKIATRMVQLGELNIGKVGELASEIGIQLLSREFLAQNLPQNLQTTPQPAAVAVTPPVEPYLETPGQGLLRDLGEQLWQYEQKETVDIAPDIAPDITPASISLEESCPSNLQHLSDQNAVAKISDVMYEYVGEEHPETVEEEVEEVVASPLAENWDQSLTNLQPQVAQTLDELVIRLEQSTSLVQQLASELALRDAYGGQSHLPAI